MIRALLLTLLAPLLLDAAPTILTNQLDVAGVDQPYSFQMQVGGETPPVTWSQSGLPPGLDINPDTGLISGFPSVTGEYMVTISVIDSTDASTMAMYTLYVLDLFRISSSFLYDGTVGAIYQQQLYVDGPYSPPVTWGQSGLPGSLNLDPMTGIISGTPTVAGEYMVTITAQDGEASMTMMDFTLTIYEPLMITTAVLPAATVGQPYSVQLMVTGGSPPYFWEQDGLPSDFSLSSDGLLTGMPMAAGSTMVDFIVSDGIENFTDVMLQLNVNPPLVISTASLPSGTVGQSYSSSVAATGGSPPYSFGWTNQPPGLMMGSDGTISGTPTTFGNYTATVTVTDMAMVMTQKDLGLMVNPAALVISTASLPSGTVGQSYSSSVAATGGTPPYSFGWTNQPPGLTMGTDGSISGTPTTFGNYTATVTVTDMAMVMTQKDLGLMVNPAALVISTASLPSGTVGQSYSSSVAATGGTPPYSFGWTNQPPGLTMGTDGSISGTPTTSGNYTPTVTVTDSAMVMTQKGLGLLVNSAALVISTASLPSGTVGQSYSSSVAATGGTPPYSFGWTNQPPGLTMGTDGSISGTPTTSGNYTPTVTVTDSDMVMTQKGLGLLVNPAGLVISTASLPSGTVGQSYSSSVAATGGTPPYSFGWTNQPPGLTMGTDGSISGTPTTSGNYTPTVTVTDSAMVMTQKGLGLLVNSAALVISTASLPSGTVGQSYSSSVAATGGTPPYSFGWTNQPPGLTMGTDGSISGTPTTSGNYTPTVTVTDSDMVMTQKGLGLLVNPAGLVISTASLPSGTVGQSYSSSVAATGGTPPYSFGWTNQPPGLTMGTDGSISGTPTTSGNYTPTVTVTDSAMVTTQKGLGLLVNPAALVISTASLPSGTVGQSYSSSVAATGGTPPYSFGWTNQPPGLTMGTDGSISGTPTTSGNYTPTVTVTDSDMVTTQKGLGLLVNPAALVISTASLPSGTVGQSYSSSVAATGGTPPYSFGWTNQPPGLTMGTDGSISGTPTTSGNYTPTVTVTDSAMVTTQKGLGLLVNPAALVISTASLPSGTVGQSYSSSVAATGGTPPYSFGWTNQPPGLTMGTDGSISGTPTTSGNYTPTVTVTDSAMVTTQKGLGLLVNPAALVISTASLPSGTVGQSYSSSVAATGGTPPYSFGWTNQPPGLTMGTDGSISGTPTTSGNYTPTVTVTDSDMVTTQKGLGLLVNPAALVISTASLPSGTVGQSYSSSVAATGGTPPYSFGWTNQPPGLTMGTDGTISGTPTTSGNYTPTVTVTDSAMVMTQKGLGLLVNPPPLVISTTTLPDGIVTQPYSASVTATGGTPPFTFTWTNQPPGLTLSPAGAISGQPTSAGSFNIQVAVHDSGGQQTQSTYPIMVRDPLAFVTDSLPAAKAGDAYSAAVFANGGSPPYTFSFDGDAPQGFTLSSNGALTGTPLTPGTLQIPMRVMDQAGAFTSRTFQLEVDAATDSFQISVSTLQFATSSGGEPPPAQSFTIVRSDGQPSSYAVTIENQSLNALPVRGPRAATTPSWLTVDPDNGHVPARMTVAADPTGLAPGTYTAQMTISSPDNPGRVPAVLPISLTLEDAPPQLSVSSSPLKFIAKSDTPEEFDQSVLIRNGGGGGPLAFTATLLQGSSWIKSVTPASGQTTPGAPVAVDIHVDTTGLAPGQYLDTLQISSDSGAAAIPVVLFVSPGGARLDLSVVGVRFQIRQGSSISIGRHVSVINRGGAGTVLRWTADILEGDTWLTLPVSSGATSPDNPADFTIRLKDSVSGFPAGPYYGLLRISDPNALGSPRYITVVLDVAPPGAPTTLDFETKGTVLVAAPGAAAVKTVTFSVGTSSVTPVAFQAAASTYNGGGWLSVSPLTGSVSSSANAQIKVTADASKLSAGIYRGEVDLARGMVVQALNITLIVADTGRAAAAIGARAASCVPSRLVVTQTGLANHFSVPGWPATMMVQVNDDCGAIVRDASAISSFSNGDPPLTLIDDGSGSYWATWQPGGATSDVNVTVRASGQGLESDSTVLIGSVTQNPTPILTPGGTLHNLNPKVGGALSPGLVVQIYGGGLAGTTGSTGQVPLANTYSGTYVLVGPYQAPLYYVSPGQLVAELPTELDVNQQYPVVVVANGAITLPDLVDVVPVEPGVAAFADGTLIAQHSDYSLVDATHPAHHGDALVMYLAGLGDTTPQVPSGEPSPSSPLAVPKVAPTLTIDGRPVTIQFVGLTPGAVGLFQINFTVPGDERTNTPLDVVVEQGGVTANTTTLTVVE